MSLKLSSALFIILCCDFSFYDKKKFSSKKEQKTIDASEKVSVLASCFAIVWR